MSSNDFNGGLVDLDRLVAGKLLNGYQVGEAIGTGGMSSIYRAQHPRFGEVVLKFLRSDLNQTEDREGVERFQAEIQALSRISHANVVKLLDNGEFRGFRYLVLPFIDGWTLGQLLKRKGTIPWEKALFICYEIALGLEAIHMQGMIHRDIKPDNIMIAKQSGIKIVDLGIAKHKDLNLTQPGQFLATLAYSSPEQIQGQDPTPSSDLFSLGSVLYESLTGEQPFQGNNPQNTMLKILSVRPPPISDHAPSIPEGVERLVTRMLEKRPAHRFGSAMAFAEEVRRLRLEAGYGDHSQEFMVSDFEIEAQGAFGGKYPFFFVRQDILDSRNASPSFSFVPLLCVPKESYLSGDKFSIGRDDDNAIVIPIKSISRTHAWVIGMEGVFYLRDNDSTNGSYVNGRRLTQAMELKAGDLVHFGPEASYIYYDAEKFQELDLPALEGYEPS